MQSPLVEAALEQLKPDAGYELVKARIEREPDGKEFVRLLLDYGIKGCKVYRVAVSPELLAVAYSPPVEAEEAPVEAESAGTGPEEAEEAPEEAPVDPESAGTGPEEAVKEVKATVKRRR